MSTGGNQTTASAVQSQWPTIVRLAHETVQRSNGLLLICLLSSDVTNIYILSYQGLRLTILAIGHIISECVALKRKREREKQEVPKPTGVTSLR